MFCAVVVNRETHLERVDQRPCRVDRRGRAGDGRAQHLDEAVRLRVQDVGQERRHL